MQLISAILGFYCISAVSSAFAACSLDQDCNLPCPAGDKNSCLGGSCRCVASPGSDFTLNMFYNGSKSGPACSHQPECTYKGTTGACTASADGTCTDIKVVCNGNKLSYYRFWATRDGSCRGPALGPFGGTADGTCHNDGDGPGKDVQFNFMTALCPAGGTDHCTHSGPKGYGVWTCHYANGTTNEKFKWGDKEECVEACRSHQEVPVRADQDHCTHSGPKGYGVWTCHYANGTTNEKYKWGDEEECVEACHSHQQASIRTVTDHCTHSGPRGYGVWTCHYANGTTNEKYKWGDKEECIEACHSHQEVSARADEDHCTHSGPKGYGVWTCHYANGTTNDKYKWGDKAECVKACHSQEIDHCTHSGPKGYGVWTCHYANGTTNEKYKWGDEKECVAACHSSQHGAFGIQIVV